MASLLVILGSDNFFIHSILLRTFVLLFLAAATKGLYNRYYHPLSGIPGPFWGSVTKLYLVYMISSVPIEGLKLHEQYGKRRCYHKRHSDKLIYLKRSYCTAGAQSPVFQRPETPSFGLPQTRR